MGIVAWYVFGGIGPQHTTINQYLNTQRHAPTPPLPHTRPNTKSTKQLVGDLVVRVITLYALLLQATCLGGIASLLPPVPGWAVRGVALLLTWWVWMVGFGGTDERSDRFVCRVCSIPHQLNAMP